MTDEEIKGFMRRAKSSARARGYFQDAEDFAQDVLLSFVRSPNSRQTIDQAVVDAIRKQETRHKNKPQFVEMEEGVDRTAEETTKEPALLGKKKKEESINRAVFLLLYGWGLSQQEIAQCFGVDKSMISQRLKIIHEKLKKRGKHG